MNHGAGTSTAAEPLRIGILGAARIAPLSIVEPAAATGHRLVAVAARDVARAREFAAEHGVERVHESYAAVIDDPDVEVVYNPLPNSLHAEWNIRAAEGGKHVLSEKPAAMNVAEARRVRDAVGAAAVVFMEGFHYPYHPLFRRVCQLLGDGAVGEVEHLEAILTMPAPPESDPRWSRELGGGSMMDLGCYSLSALRLLGPYAGGEPHVVSARRVDRAGKQGVDERLYVEVAFPSGATGSGGSDMDCAERDFHLLARGTAGEIVVPMFPVPHEGDSLVLHRSGRDDVVEHLGTRSSYTFQLEAFADAVRRGAPVVTGADWSMGNAQLIEDAVAACR
ncbi:MAG TPA: Gfo/Idh/MocA family oxidoreductase [Humibacillus sp.]|nr:Gfo/Idh/MocA family oxidoreductase [Humibacillus sp.]